MAFTVLFVVATLFVLALIFGIVWKIKGLKIALIATAGAFLAAAALFAIMIYVIVSSMPN